MWRAIMASGRWPSEFSFRDAADARPMTLSWSTWDGSGGQLLREKGGIGPQPFVSGPAETKSNGKQTRIIYPIAFGQPRHRAIQVRGSMCGHRPESVKRKGGLKNSLNYDSQGLPQQIQHTVPPKRLHRKKKKNNRQRIRRKHPRRSIDGDGFLALKRRNALRGSMTKMIPKLFQHDPKMIPN